MTQRDIFISDLFELAKIDKDIILISVDMGASALDRWREELPDQFIWTGISEQHSINLAAGLSASGKKVYVYFMAAWSARCFEQIRYSCSIANNPITILANGVALGYTPAGPAHSTNEDIAYMRSLLNIEINCPSNLQMTKELVLKSYHESKLRYIRLERNYDNRFDNEELHTPVKKGIANIKLKFKSKLINKSSEKIVLVSYGYMLGRCFDVCKKLIENNYDCSLFNIYTLKPNPIYENTFNEYDKIITVEEQTLSGGMGSIILEGLANYYSKKLVLRIGLPEYYIFDNGDREFHLNQNGLSINTIYSKVVDFIHI